MLEINTRVVVTLVPLPGPARRKRVYGRLAAAYPGKGPVAVRSGGQVTVVPAEHVLFVQTREEHKPEQFERPDWLYNA